MRGESNARRYRIDRLAFDALSCEISDGQSVWRLQRKPARVLERLLERSPAVVSREELARLLWPREQFELLEDRLNHVVSRLRNALAECGIDGAAVETCPGVGYRLAVPAGRLSESPPTTGGDGPAGSPLRWRFAAGVAALAVIGVAMLIILALPIGTDPGIAVGDAPIQQKASIAVLPFANISGDPSQKHFADGLTEELLNSLTAIDELRVISRTSSFAVDPSRPLREVAATLGVGHILEGSVRRAGDRIRVTAQLIDAKSDSHLWSESYNRELTLENILQMQEEIALAVVDALQVTLFTPSSSSLSRDGPDNLAALDLYHEGMFYVRQIETGQAEHPTTFHQAIEKLEASIDADPDWAPSHAALGEVYHFWMDFGDAATKIRTAKAHIMDAIRLDDTYGSAYTSLGYILTHDGDYEGAMRAYDRSISLGGRWPAGGAWGKAILLAALGRYDEAVGDYREALAQDPLSVTIKAQLVQAYYCAGQYAEAVEGAVAVLGIEPHSPHMEVLLATAHARTGDVEKGLEIADALAEWIDTEEPFALLFALAGQEARARAALDKLERNEPDWAPSVLLQVMVPAALALGEEQRALTMLEHVTTNAASDLHQAFEVTVSLRCSPEVRSLAGNPRYEALLDRLGRPN